MLAAAAAGSAARRHAAVRSALPPGRRALCRGGTAGNAGPPLLAAGVQVVVVPPRRTVAAVGPARRPPPLTATRTLPFTVGSGGATSDRPRQWPRARRSSSGSRSSSNSDQFKGDRAAAAKAHADAAAAADESLLDALEEIVDVDAAALAAAIDRSKFTTEIPVKMPDLGGAAKQSTVVKWYFAPGDVVQRGDVLCDIATPDFTFGMETDDEELAIFRECHVAVDQPVPDGTVICTLLHETHAKKDEKTEKSAADATAKVGANNNDDDVDDDEDEKAKAAATADKNVAAKEDTKAKP